jgi:hypothetical protein
MRARNYFYCLYSCTGDPNQPAKNIFARHLHWSRA